MVQKKMTGSERREQLISIGRQAFAELGFDGTSVEEIASRAGVTKPVVYEHFGGKEGLYAVVVDREIKVLDGLISESLKDGSWRERIDKVALTMLTYVEDETDGFAILVRDSKPAVERSFSSLLSSAVNHVSVILERAFIRRGFDPELAPLYGQALVGTISMTAQWWLDERSPDKETVAAHVVNLCWNGLSDLQKTPRLQSQKTQESPVPVPGVEEDVK